MPRGYGLPSPRHAWGMRLPRAIPAPRGTGLPAARGMRGKRRRLPRSLGLSAAGGCHGGSWREQAGQLPLGSGGDTRDAAWGGRAAGRRCGAVR